MEALTESLKDKTLLAVEAAQNFDELGMAHVKLILSGAGKTYSKMAKDQAFYNASVITRMLEILLDNVASSDKAQHKGD